MKRLFRKNKALDQTTADTNHPDPHPYPHSLSRYSSPNDPHSQLPPSPPSGYNSNAALAPSLPSHQDPHNPHSFSSSTLDPGSLVFLHPPTPSSSPPSTHFQLLSSNPDNPEKEKPDPQDAMLAGFTAQSKKKPNFLARFHSKNSFKSFNQPPSNAQPSSEIEACVAWFCASDDHIQDWAYILEFCDRLSTSEVGCKEAAHALRKQLKHAPPLIQARVIRLIVILVLNSSDRLRLQIASKKFLETVEEVFNKAAKDPHHGQQVREMIWKAFSVLAYEFQRDADLQAFTHLYNKIKPPDGPMGGAPLEQSDMSFTPDGNRPSRNHGPPVPPHPFEAQAPLPETRDLAAEAEVARANARLLIEALAYTTPSEMHSNELIQEFHSKCLQNQNQLLDDIPWATARADQARLLASNLASPQPLPQTNPFASNLAPHQPLPQTNPFASNQASHQPLPQTNPFASDLAAQQPLSQTNPFAPLVNGTTQSHQTRGPSQEEQLLANLLSANSDLVDAFRQYDQMEKLARNEAELRLAEARSKVETRLGNSLPTDMAGSSGSAPHQEQQQPEHQKASSLPLGSRNSSEQDTKGAKGYVVEDKQQPKPVPERILGSAQPFPSGIGWANQAGPIVNEPDTFESSSIPPASSRLHPRFSQKTDDSIIPDRSEPSEKALGKMRRISDFLPETGQEGLSSDERAELERRRVEVESKFRERYRLYHQQQQIRETRDDVEHAAATTTPTNPPHVR